MPHEHDLDAEYLYPSDASVVGLSGRDGELVVTVLVPCPECDEPVELTATVTAVEDSDLELPLSDAADVYD